MRFCVLLVAFVASLGAQTATPAQPVTGSRNFYAAGVNFFASTQPKPSGWGAVAVELTKNVPAWEITETDVNYVSGTKQLVSSVRTGMATQCSIGQFKLYCYGALGVATTGSATTGAYSGGFIYAHPIKAGSKLDMIFAARALKTAATGPEFLISIGLGTGGVK
jgi:hypothetical protein